MKWNRRLFRLGKALQTSSIRTCYMNPASGKHTPFTSKFHLNARESSPSQGNLFNFSTVSSLMNFSLYQAMSAFCKLSSLTLVWLHKAEAPNGLGVEARGPMSRAGQEPDYRKWWGPGPTNRHTDHLQGRPKLCSGCLPPHRHISPCHQIFWCDAINLNFSKKKILIFEYIGKKLWSSNSS